MERFAGGSESTEPLIGIAEASDSEIFERAEAQREWLSIFGIGWTCPNPELILAFLADRLKVQQREAGVRHDLIDAVFALGGEDDLVRLLARVKALQAFVETGEGANLLAGYKRAANILKKESWDAAAASDADVLPDEAALVAALDRPNRPPIIRSKHEENFTAAMPRSNRSVPIEHFSTGDSNDADPGVRDRR